MKRLLLLLPLLLSGVPLSSHAHPEADQQLVAPAKAGSVWLVLKEGGEYYGQFSVALEKIEMKNMDQCQEQGALWISSNTIGGRNSNTLKMTGFECIEGR